MNMFEEAKTLCDMAAMCKMTQSEMARKLNVSQSYIANKIRLLKLPPPLRKRILEAGLSERHARALLSLFGEDQEKALDKIVKGRLTVAAAEAVINGMQDEKKLQALKSVGKEGNLSAWEEAMDASLSLLKKCGLAVEKKVETYRERTYITIAIG